MRCVRIAALLAISLCGCREREHRAQAPGPVAREDSDNGLTLRLSLDKAICKRGETIRATVTLENTASEAVAIHYLFLFPTYVPKSEIDKRQTDDSELLFGWRYAYSIPTALDTGGAAYTGCSLVIDAYSGSEAEVKKAYEDNLYAGAYPDFPAYAIPPGHTVSAWDDLKVTEHGGFVDAGLFGREWWYTERVRYLSGKGLTRAPWLRTEKAYPKIWTGSLYLKIPVHVR
jgi:hypothetical protein